MTGYVAVGKEPGIKRLNGESNDFDPKHLDQADVDRGLIGAPTDRGLRLKDHRISSVTQIPVGFIKDRADLKRTDHTHRKAVKRDVGVLAFIEPLLLDAEFTIIDGQARLELYRELQTQGYFADGLVPVVILDVTPLEAEEIRIYSNRMGELPRWDFKNEGSSNGLERHPGLYDFLDANTQLQPLLEPLGIWFANSLPNAYFEKTVLAYPDENNESPKYTPEIGLEKWAEIQRAATEKKRSDEALSPVKDFGDYLPVDQLEPIEADFVEIHPVEQEVEDYIGRMRELAGVITDNYDRKRKAELEAAGKKWQNTRRGANAVIADLKAEQKIQAEDHFDDELETPAEELPTDD